MDWLACHTKANIKLSSNFNKLQLIESLSILGVMMRIPLKAMESLYTRDFYQERRVAQTTHSL